jgi:hypothetical protein
MFKQDVSLIISNPLAAVILTGSIFTKGHLLLIANLALIKEASLPLSTNAMVVLSPKCNFSVKVLALDGVPWRACMDIFNVFILDAS